MAIRFDKFVSAGLVLAFAGIFNCQTVLAHTQIQPFLCAGQDGSNVGWVPVQGQKVIGITLRESGDQGGAKFVDIAGSDVKSNSTVTVGAIQNVTSSNLIVRLTLRLSNGQTFVFSPTSSSSNSFNWNLAAFKLNPSANITHMAAYAQNSTNSPGTIFFTQFFINGTAKTNQINSRAGCLSY